MTPAGEAGEAAPRGDVRFLVAAWAAFVVLRLLIARGHQVVGIDEALYFSYGDSWLRTGTYSGIQWPVVYPLVAATLARLIGGRAAVDAIFVVGGSLLVPPLFLAVRRLRGSRVARWTIGCVILLPATGAVIAKSGTHSLYLPLLALGFALHASALQAPRLPTLAGLGAVIGLAYVTRTDGIVYLGVVPVALLLTPSATPWRGRLRSAAVVAIVGAALALPNVLHLRQHTGRWQISPTIGGIMRHDFFLEKVRDPTLRRMTEDLRRGDERAERMARNPAYHARRIAFNARLALRVLGDMHGLTIPLIALAGLGVARLLSGGGRAALLALAWAAPPAAFLALHVEARYLSATCLFLTLLSGEGCVVLADAMRARGFGRAVPVVAAAVAASLLLMSLMTLVALRQIEEHDVPRKAAVARRLAGERMPETFIVSTQVRFLVDGARAGSKSAPMTRRADATYYLFDPTDEERDERPFLDEIRAAGGELAVVDEDSSGMILYELRPRPAGE